MTNSELVFIPVPGIGHLVSTIEFAKRLLARDQRLSVTILYIRFDFSEQADALTESIVGSQPRIKLIHLPQAASAPEELLKKSFEMYVYIAIESVAPQVRNALRDLVSSSETKVVGVVIDFFCTHLSGLAAELRLPSYMFMTSNLGFVNFMLQLPSRHDRTFREFEMSDPKLMIPGFANLVPVSSLPTAVFSKDGGYTTFLKLAQGFGEMKGIIVNSFTELERRTLGSLIGEETTPPIYMVGPVLGLEVGQPHPRSKQAQNEEIMKWLESQPRSSVVFLCFGSMGRFGVTQLREMASGLEQSGCRFLWCIRVPESKSVEEILPEGFLDRIGKRGLICDDWAPQTDVLAHGAVGGFVSHCGWNSILESLWFGVPIATWPMYAEQQLNAFQMVKEFELAVEISLEYRSGAEDVVVSADVIKSAVRKLMEGESKLRKDVKEMSELARKAVEEGGCSSTAIGRFIDDILGSN